MVAVLRACASRVQDPRGADHLVGDVRRVEALHEAASGGIVGKGGKREGLLARHELQGVVHRRAGRALRALDRKDEQVQECLRVADLLDRDVKVVVEHVPAAQLPELWVRLPGDAGVVKDVGVHAVVKETLAHHARTRVRCQWAGAVLLPLAHAARLFLGTAAGMI